MEMKGTLFMWKRHGERLGHGDDGEVVYEKKMETVYEMMTETEMLRW